MADGPWARLQAAFAFAFTKVEEGQEAPDVPQGLTEWAQNTSLTTVIGCGYGAWSQHRRLQQGQVDAEPAATPTSKAYAARAIAEAKTRRIALILNESIKGGLRFGSLAAVYYGVQGLMGVARARQDLRNTVAAGLTSGALFGAFYLPARGGGRLRSSLLGAGLGAAVALPVGFVQQQLQVVVDSNSPAKDPRTTAAETYQQSSTARRIPQHSTGTTDSVIAQLEASIQPRPEREKRVPP